MKAIFANPVLLKEIKLRFRSFKAFNGILFFLLAMCVFVFGYIFLTVNVAGTSYFKPSQSFVLFAFLSYIQLGLVLFTTPGLTAGTISSEREKQTLPILLTTSQTSFQIISGKLLSSIAFLLLLIVAGLPVYSLVFVFGGISPLAFLKVFLFLFVILLSIGSIGVMYSTLLRKTIVSMIATYGTMLFLSVVTGFLLIITVQMNMMTVYSGAVSSPPPAYLAHFLASINPVVLFASFLSPEVSGAIEEMTQVDIPLWAGFLVFYLLLAVLAIFIAVKKLRVNPRKKKG